MRNVLVITLLLLTSSSADLFAAKEKPLSRAEAEAALHKAVAFFRKNCSADGGYLYRYSADLKKREGEGVASRTTAWIQPPGTPAVGEVYLKLYSMTGDKYFLEAAIETGMALVAGQLQSGGWSSSMEMGEKERRRHAYRQGGNPKGRNVTTFDDDKSQSALSFLMRLDQVLKFKDKKIHETVEYALKHFLAAQYPNGAWPQGYSKAYNPREYVVKRANYPDTWSRTFPKIRYTGFYTFNDNNIVKLIEMMFLAEDIYGDSRFRKSAMKAGDFILLSQMPDPQPIWAQQYNLEMQPVWARKFEPPSVTGGETQGLLVALMRLYQKTGEKKYLEPIPRALEYLKKVELPGEKLARFYELKTDKPLYFTKDYQLTYSSADMPTHYGFIVSSKVDSIESRYQKIKNTPPSKLRTTPKPPTYRMSKSRTKRAATAIKSLDKRGAWVEAGSMQYHKNDNTTRIIDTKTFMKNALTLGEFIAASEK